VQALRTLGVTIMLRPIGKVRWRVKPAPLRSGLRPASPLLDEPCQLDDMGIFARQL